MQKLSAEQKVYVTLPKTDHIEASSEEIKSSDLKPNWIMEIINKIVESFKQKGTKEKVKTKESGITLVALIITTLVPVA